SISCVFLNNRFDQQLCLLPQVPQAPEAKASQPEAKEQTPPADTPAKEEPPAATAVSAPSEPEPTPSSFPDDTSLKNHEPHLGPKPRTHNRVLNPPGGKSSVVFY
uniref:Jupiter microtubule associated homolog 2 n=1 Tax=Oreochromis aureus TaxID=47969 RepID=A0AAZ1X4T3_OREAU